MFNYNHLNYQYSTCHVLLIITTTNWAISTVKQRIISNLKATAKNIHPPTDKKNTNLTYNKIAVFNFKQTANWSQQFLSLSNTLSEIYVQLR
jgi:hypothetical protein